MVEFKCTNQFFLHAEVFTVHNTEFSLDIERFLQAYKNVQFQEDPSIYVQRGRAHAEKMLMLDNSESELSTDRKRILRG